MRIAQNNANARRPPPEPMQSSLAPGLSSNGGGMNGFGMGAMGGRNGMNGMGGGMNEDEINAALIAQMMEEDENQMLAE